MLSTCNVLQLRSELTLQPLQHLPKLKSDPAAQKITLALKVPTHIHILKIYMPIFNFPLQDHHRLVLETFNQDTVEVFSALFQNQLLMQKSKVESALCGGSSTAVIVETIVNC